MEKPKKVGIIQSNYIPWIGYFDFIQSCDLFIFHDDIQYTKGDWRNRNKILSPHGVKWISVPVHYKESQKTTIQNTTINYSLDWVSEHEKWLTLSYKNTPHFDLLAQPFLAILKQRHETISQLNVGIIRWIMNYLEIETPIEMSNTYQVHGAKTDRVLELLKKAKADVYISGPNAKGYLEEEKFNQAKVGLRYKSYSYKPYPQKCTPFTPGLTILDLLFNCGPDSKQYIHCNQPDQIIY